MTVQPITTYTDFRRLWIGETASKLGSSITSVALPLVAVTVLHATTLQVGLLAAASWLPWLLIGLPAGAWVDRLPRRPVMLACNVISMAMMASVPVAAWLGVLTVWQLLAVALLTGAANVFFTTAYQVFLPSLLPVPRLREGNARMQGSESATQVAGPGLAGLLASVLGVVNGLWADVVSFAVSTFCLLRIRERETPPVARRTTTLRREIAAGLRFVARDPYLRVLTVFGSVSNLTMVGYQSLLVIFLVRVVGLTPGVVGVLVMAMSLGGVLGALIADRVARRFGTAHGALLCQFAACPFALLIPLTGQGPRVAFVVVAGIVIGAGVVASNVIRSSWRQAYTPREMLGRVSVSMQFLNFGTIPLGAVLAGLLGDAFGIRPTMWMMTVGVALAPLILLIGPMRKHRDLPSPPAKSVATDHAAVVS